MDAIHKEGDLVFHDEWGTGRVMVVDGDELRINFFGRSEPENVTIEDWRIESVEAGALERGARWPFERAAPLSVLHPEEAFSETQFEEYERRRDTVWKQLVWIERGLYTCETLAEFPFDLFDVRPDLGFFRTVFRYTEEGVLTKMFRLFDDKKGQKKYRRLFRFRDFVMTNADSRCEPEIRYQLRQARIDNRLVRRARDYRNQAVAHLDDDIVIDHELRGSLHVDWSELRLLQDQCLECFNVLCMGHGMGHETLNYRAGDSELEDLLDLVAENSRVFRIAVEGGERWERVKERYSEEQLATVEEWVARLA